ncbi:ROBO3 protein, partial [Nyctibius grandis]|nr:ROBO3 protein [Nyctibius grandis]
RRRRWRPAKPSRGSTPPARGKGSSSATPSIDPPTRLAPTRTARGSTKRISRCRWCCSRETTGCTGSGPRRRPRAGSSCALSVSVGMGNPPLQPGSLWRKVCRVWQLMVIPSLPEPLSEPEIVGNSSVKAGRNTKLVCNVLEGKADLYWWKKNGEVLLGSDRIQFVDNTTLCIVKASMNDSGYYACVVRNAVSQNETSFLLHVQSKWGFLPGVREGKRGKWPKNPTGDCP